ncbi:hypothetical protein [Deminuibacter soli]|uniref:Uncharacterized protein n=1 Tax=Deminuibacter soli TaxID=2291815 RepID=A0A3E1NQ28_9BACT|nr:hypothetical protein [Deminuibacter soli]RFM30007.1 hypothetical protein DXN05_03275 [Deminuibacter soli]
MALFPANKRLLHVALLYLLVNSTGCHLKLSPEELAAAAAQCKQQTHYRDGFYILFTGLSASQLKAAVHISITDTAGQTGNAKADTLHRIIMADSSMAGELKVDAEFDMHSGMVITLDNRPFTFTHFTTAPKIGVTGMGKETIAGCYLDSASIDGHWQKYSGSFTINIKEYTP